MKTKINNHASVLIAYNKEKVLTNIYDKTYPKKIWRNRINLIGGGQSKEDLSPKELLEREITEEFSLNYEEQKTYDSDFSKIVGEGLGAPKIYNFASENDISKIRENLLKNYEPYSDFLASFPKYKDRPPFNVLFNVYSWEIPDEIFEIIEKNISNNKSLVNEGFLKISKIENLSSGNTLTAWNTGQILEEFFKVKIPNPENILSTKLGYPKNSFEEYKEEFENELTK